MYKLLFNNTTSNMICVGTFFDGETINEKITKNQ